MIEATGVKWAELENWNAVLIRVAKMAAAEPWNERLRDQVADEVARAWAAVDGRGHVLCLWSEAKAAEPKPAAAEPKVEVKRRKIETPLSDAELKAVQERLVSSSAKMQPEAVAQPAKPLLDRSVKPAWCRSNSAPVTMPKAIEAWRGFRQRCWSGRWQRYDLASRRFAGSAPCT